MAEPLFAPDLFQGGPKIFNPEIAPKTIPRSVLCFAFVTLVYPLQPQGPTCFEEPKVPARRWTGCTLPPLDNVADTTRRSSRWYARWWLTSRAWHSTCPWWSNCPDPLHLNQGIHLTEETLSGRTAESFCWCKKNYSKTHMEWYGIVPGGSF